jgi:hypothetical protein
MGEVEGQERLDDAAEAVDDRRPEQRVERTRQATKPRSERVRRHPREA